MTRAFAYLRVSGKGQVDGDGFERQECAIRDYARVHQIQIQQIYKEEGVSGTVEDRPALLRLMDDLEENGHGVKTVIVERLDRVARDLALQERIIGNFKKLGYNLISATEGADLLEDDATRTLVRQVIGAIAEYDKSIVVAKLKAARDRKREQTGRCEGPRPFTESINGQAVLTEIKRLRRKRPGCKRKTYSEIAAILNSQGFKTAQGKMFTAYHVMNVRKS